MSTVDTAGWIICPTCAYPHEPEQGCPNPACPDNPAHSTERRARILDDIAAYHIAQTARAETARLYASSFGRRP